MTHVLEMVIVPVVRRMGGGLVMALLKGFDAPVCDVPDPNPRASITVPSLKPEPVKSVLILPQISPVVVAVPRSMKLAEPVSVVVVLYTALLPAVCECAGSADNPIKTAKVPKNKRLPKKVLAILIQFSPRIVQSLCSL